MLKRTINIVAVTLLIFNATMPIMSQIDKEIRFTCVENELFGVLTLPNAKKPYPAIILLHGSDRGVADNYKQYANELIRSGFAVLTYDSPGKGKSTGSTVGETFEYRYQEAISAINYLQSRQDIKPDGMDTSLKTEMLKSLFFSSLSCLLFYVLGRSYSGKFLENIIKTGFGIESAIISYR